MNITEKQAENKMCPVMSKVDDHQHCIGSGCMFWQWDEAMIDGPDSYVSDPPPTGHCGAIKGMPT